MNPIRVRLHLNNSGGGESPFTVSGRVGSPAIPMFIWAAAPAGNADLLYGGPECTTTGPVCGRCTGGRDLVLPELTVRHASAAHVRACDVSARYIEAEQRAEWPLTRAGIL